MEKLKKDCIPDNHSKSDFTCFGPVAEHDGQFTDNMLCDLGCFKQDSKDSNKYFHAAIVQSTKTSDWYVYTEWGRTSYRGQCQFYKCRTQNEAKNIYADILHKKNDHRGEWINHPLLGRTLQAKAGKDCYLVRPQSSRTIGLPNAANICNLTSVITSTATSPAQSLMDDNSIKLLNDLGGGTLAYATKSLTDGAIPSQIAIDDARNILNHALKNLNNKDTLKQLTEYIYSKIPKYKPRKSSEESWLLSAENINGWNKDLDAFESAINIPTINTQVNYPFILNTVDGQIREFLEKWIYNASNNKHKQYDNVKIKNIWKIDRQDALQKFINKQKEIIVNTATKPLFQPNVRLDIDKSQLNFYTKSNTAMLFHGTRSVNVLGILNNFLRLPKELVNVKITGALFGPGIYFADDFRKSLGYTSHTNSYWASGGGGIRGRGAFMFISDVILGNPHQERNSRSYNSPPSGYHSVFGVGGGYVLNNEFIIYDSNQHYLRYLVELE